MAGCPCHAPLAGTQHQPGRLSGSASDIVSPRSRRRARDHHELIGQEVPQPGNPADQQREPVPWHRGVHEALGPLPGHRSQRCARQQCGDVLAGEPPHVRRVVQPTVTTRPRAAQEHGGEGRQVPDVGQADDHVAVRRQVLGEGAQAAPRVLDVLQDVGEHDAVIGPVELAEDAGQLVEVTGDDPVEPLPRLGRQLLVVLRRRSPGHPGAVSRHHRGPRSRSRRPARCAGPGRCA